MNNFDIIQADGHKIQACGASTGHFVKTVAMCENASIADFLLRGAAEQSTLVAQNEWLKDRLAFLQLPASRAADRDKWLVECGMPARAALSPNTETAP